MQYAELDIRLPQEHAQGTYRLLQIYCYKNMIHFRELETRIMTLDKASKLNVSAHFYSLLFIYCYMCRNLGMVDCSPTHHCRGKLSNIWCAPPWTDHWFGLRWQIIKHIVCILHWWDTYGQQEVELERMELQTWDLAECYKSAVGAGRGRLARLCCVLETLPYHSMTLISELCLRWQRNAIRPSSAQPSPVSRAAVAHEREQMPEAWWDSGARQRQGCSHNRNEQSGEMDSRPKKK